MRRFGCRFVGRFGKGDFTNSEFADPKLKCKRTTETALPARCARWDCERYVDVVTTTLRGDTARKPNHRFFVPPAGPGGT